MIYVNIFPRPHQPHIILHLVVIKHLHTIWLPVQILTCTVRKGKVQNLLYKCFKPFVKGNMKKDKVWTIKNHYKKKLYSRWCFWNNLYSNFPWAIKTCIFKTSCIKQNSRKLSPGRFQPLTFDTKYIKVIWMNFGIYLVLRNLIKCMVVFWSMTCCE